VEQIKSYVLDVVRAKVPKMSLDEVFEKKDDVGLAVKNELDVSMKVYGFEIPNALVTDVNPADSVKAAMNEIQTQQRLQVAAAAKGEANKILVVKNAEAEAESKHLQGEGIAKQRRAIVDGLRDSIAAFSDKVGAVTAQGAQPRAAHAIFRHAEGDRRLGRQQSDPDAALARRHDRHCRTTARRDHCRE
jgi:regulator of protease activity HflC (stomatin/prohibitin superfamily)